MRGRVLLTPEQVEQLRAHWLTRALLAAEEAERSNGDPLFRILCAALKKPTENPPWWGPTAVIMVPEGEDADERDPEKAVLWSNYLEANSIEPAQARPVCTVRDLTDNLNRLADALSFSDNERLALFSVVQKWVVLDERERPEDRLEHTNPTP